MRATRFLALGVGMALAGLASADVGSTVSMHKDDLGLLKELAQRILSPEVLRIAQNPELYNQDGSADLTVFDAANPHRRRLGATNEECGIFLAASIAPTMWECFSMAQTVLGLYKVENCKTTYDISQANLEQICTSQCYDILLKALTTMSQAGCSASVLKQSCNECATDEKCVEGKCRKLCSVDRPCSCDDTCTGGACVPPKNSEVQVSRSTRTRSPQPT
jgi:hypothetical protein